MGSYLIKPLLPAPGHIHLAKLLGSNIPEVTKLLPTAWNCSETSHWCDSQIKYSSTSLSAQQAQPKGRAEGSCPQKLSHPDTGGSWHKACVQEPSRLRCEHISSVEVVLMIDVYTSRDGAEQRGFQGLRNT